MECINVTFIISPFFLAAGWQWYDREKLAGEYDMFIFYCSLFW